MGKPIGSQKTGGRQKGTPNRKSLNGSVLFQDYGFDPFGELIKLMDELLPDQKAKTILRLMEFVFPKRKAITFSEDEFEQSEPAKADYSKLTDDELVQLSTILAKASILVDE